MHTACWLIYSIFFSPCEQNAQVRFCHPFCLKGVYWNQRAVGWAVARSVESCVVNYFLSFWTILVKFRTNVCLGVLMSRHTIGPWANLQTFFFPLGHHGEVAKFRWASNLLGSCWGFFILFLPHHMRWGFEVCKTLITLFQLQYLLPINKLVHVVDLMLWLCFMR